MTPSTGGRENIMSKSCWAYCSHLELILTLNGVDAASHKSKAYSSCCCCCCCKCSISRQSSWL